MDLRISSGIYKNKRLKVTETTKPVMEKVKNAVFSILEEKIVSAKVLDLFAGSGNLGIEALSRGAAFCTFVEINKNTIKTLEKNLDGLSYDNVKTYEIITSNAVKYIANDSAHYDIVFLDPPYELSITHILKYLFDSLNDKGIAIYFHNKNMTINIDNIDKNLVMIDSRIYGITKVDFITKKDYN